MKSCLKQYNGNNHTHVLSNCLRWAEMTVTARTHFKSPRFDITQPHKEKPPFLQATMCTVNKAAVCQELYCKICMYQWNMHIAVCHQWHSSYKGSTAYTWNTSFSDSIPLTLIGVDTRKDSSGWIIKPSTNIIAVRLNKVPWTTHLLLFD